MSEHKDDTHVVIVDEWVRTGDRVMRITARYETVRLRRWVCCACNQSGVVESVNGERPQVPDSCPACGGTKIHSAGIEHVLVRVPIDAEAF